MTSSRYRLASRLYVLLQGTTLVYIGIFFYNYSRSTSQRRHECEIEPEQYRITPIPERQHVLNETQIATLEERFKFRRQVLQDACRSLPNYPIRGSMVSRILVDPSHEVMYCQVPKVGSSNWLRAFLILTGDFFADEYIGWVEFDSISKYYKRLSKYKGLERVLLIRKYKKFLFVRHPFSRLLSAYINKFVERSSDEFKEKMLRAILKVTGSNATEINFSDFVDYLILTKDSIDTWNYHYRPIYQLCAPCEIKYDIIGHLETVADDSAYVLKMIDANFDYPDFAPGATNSSNLTKLKKYFDLLTPTQIKALYRIYEMDFNIFGYTLPSVLNVTVP
ncbi:carbohydrate sulfotransferase 10-like [Glandiceps talaboti]